MESTDDRQTLNFLRLNERQIDVGFGNLKDACTNGVFYGFFHETSDSVKLHCLFFTMEFIVSCFKLVRQIECVVPANYEDIHGLSIVSS